MEKRILYIVLAVLSPLVLANGCSLMDDAEYVSAEELGLTMHSCIVEPDAGLVKVPFYANKPGHIKLNSSWARLGSTTFDRDGEMLIEYDDNSGFARMETVILSLDGTERKDTLFLKQKGEKTPVLETESANIVVYNGGQETSVAVNTNIEFRKFNIKTVYLGNDTREWVKAVSLSNGRFYFTTEDNDDKINPRSARVEIEYIDGWNEKYAISYLLTQANANNALGEIIPFDELKKMAVTGEYTPIQENYIIEGYVVSDKDSGNVNENVSVTMTTIDYSISSSSMYFESLDGKEGFLIQTETPEDNILKNNTKAQISLSGANIMRYDDPERYVITDVKQTMFVRANAVDPSVIPEKKIRMSALTDKDIYTRVELTDCEYPVRKGSLTPIHEGYANSCNGHRVSKAATLIRDIEGNSMYMYTNTTCPYRRDGSRIGYGSGSVKGVVVHEKFRSFIDEDNADEDLCGNIGRYQIRHQSRSDIAFADDFHNGFSEMICEWRYLDKNAVVPEFNNGFCATYGEGVMQHTRQGYINNSSSSSQTMACAYGHIDFTYLGPVGDSDSNPFGLHKGNENGFGVILEDGSDFGINDNCVNADGKGCSDATCKECVMCWANSYWWDTNKKEGFSWLVKFSTEGISTDILSLQFATLNQSQKCLSPRFWKVEWSEDNKNWKHIADYTVPDIGIWTNTLPSQCLQHKPVNVTLPLEMLNRSTVYIRLIPSSMKSSDGKQYANTDMVNGTSVNSLSYFAIRYNK